MISGQGNQSQIKISREEEMTPAIQNHEHIQALTREEASAQSLNLTHIFKKMKPFPEKMSRPPLIVSVDMGRNSWQAAFLSSRKTGTHAVEGMGKARWLLDTVRKEMRRLGVRETGDVVLCYEIGRDGLWVRDWFEAHGFPCVILSPDVVAGNGRDPKTDRLDATRLAVRLARFFDGELECDHVHLPPPCEIQEWRVVSRAREQAVKARTMFGNEFKAVLALHGEVPPGLDVGRTDVDRLRDALGNALPEIVVENLKRLQTHWLAMDADVAAADRRMRDACSRAKAKAKAGAPLQSRESMLLSLMRLKGIGIRTAWVMVHELFYKSFRNTRQVGSATGLTAVPRSSGSSDRCAGISRRSNSRLRGMLVELAWMWHRHQPGSALAKWFDERTRNGVSSRRMRKVAIVAVARKLSVALWKYLVWGTAPEDAVLSAA